MANDTRMELRFGCAPIKHNLMYQKQQHDRKLEHNIIIQELSDLHALINITCNLSSSIYLHSMGSPVAPV